MSGTSHADGRTRLLDTALRMFDEHGLDSISARAVAKQAGHRNVGAVRYHFGDLHGLLVAVLARQQMILDVRRHQLLDELEARGGFSPRETIDAMFAPHVELLSNLAGRRFLRVFNQTANHPSWYGDAGPEQWGSNQRGALLLFPLRAHLPEEMWLHRTVMAFDLCSSATAEQARLIDHPHPARPVLDPGVFKNDLVTVMERILGA